jgi:hypothetical protein
MHKPTPSTVEIDEALVVTQLVALLRDCAKSRQADVVRGAETPRLAALIVQKYGRGMAATVATLFDTPRAADPITQALDDEVERLDPKWREHQRERWEARPADVTSSA